MRITTATLPLSALLAAACSGPSEQQIAEANAEFAKCANDAIAGTIIKRSKASLTNLNADVKPAHADFSFEGFLPDTKEQVEERGKKFEAIVSASIVFQSSADKKIAAVSGFSDSTGHVGGSNRFFNENLDPNGGEQRGVNVKVIYPKLQKCADDARASLHTPS